jgi:hypothetical protein
MTPQELKAYVANKRKNQYKDHYDVMQSETPTTRIRCGSFTDREWRKVGVSGKSSFNSKASKHSYGKLWRYYNVTNREKFQYNS